MLTAFKAQSIVELKQRDKSKIECVLAYGMHRCSQLLLTHIDMAQGIEYL